ncbi:MAG TPA: SLC13 family permease [Acidimicrobiales bacterium]|nr:SLC13 family permease [Acidimicrobiales bacterium]
MAGELIQAALSILLLLAGVAGAVGRPFRLPAWVIPAVAAATDLAAGTISPDSARRSLDPLSQAIGFLLAAVPLAVLLDRLGFFSTVATILARRGRGAGGLWVLGALVTTVLNLDAGVVLLTPLYVRFARTSGRDPFSFAAQPVLLACLASSALPVSNLTNLIAQSETGAGTLAFVTHLGLPSLAACTVGWLCYRRALPGALEPAVSLPSPDVNPSIGGGRVDTRRALGVGGAVVVAVLVGFVAGRSAGIEPWMVALGADVVLVAVVRRVTWKDVPVGTALVAASLGVLAAAAVGHIPVHDLIGGSSLASLARTAAVTGVAANLVNNLPALLVTLPAVGPRPTPALWAVLIGVNMGPVLIVTGSLASLLWLDALGRLGVKVRARDFSRIGLRIGLPAAAAGLAVEVALRAAGLGG